MQRAIEKRGIPTVSVSAARDITEYAKPPRTLFVPFRMGHHFGVPGYAAGQHQVLAAALDLLTSATESGAIADFPLTWADMRRAAQEAARAPTAGTGASPRG